MVQLKANGALIFICDAVAINRANGALTFNLKTT